MSGHVIGNRFTYLLVFLALIGFAYLLSEATAAAPMPAVAAFWA